jgi:hypothetical protein
MMNSVAETAGRSFVGNNLSIAALTTMPSSRTEYA